MVSLTTAITGELARSLVGFVVTEVDLDIPLGLLLHVESCPKASITEALVPVIRARFSVPKPKPTSEQQVPTLSSAGHTDAAYTLPWGLAFLATPEQLKKTQPKFHSCPRDSLQGLFFPPLPSSLCLESYWVFLFSLTRQLASNI